MFTLDERVAFLNEALEGLTNVEVDVFSRAGGRLRAQVGGEGDRQGPARDLDFEWEFQMNQLNRTLAPEVETVYVMASPEVSFVSSSGVKEIASFGERLTGSFRRRSHDGSWRCFRTGGRGRRRTQGMNETQRLESLLEGGNGGNVTLPRRDALELAQKLKVRGNPGAATRLVELLNSPGDVDLNPEEAKNLLEQLRESGRRWVFGTNEARNCRPSSHRS